MCPVCRRLLAIQDTSAKGRTLVPLEIKFMTSNKRKAEDDPKGKGKAKEVDAGKENRQSKRLKREKREESDGLPWGYYLYEQDG
jgi:hypothetical protein